jgi:transposase
VIIGPPSGTRIWLVAGHTDLRKGVDGLSALVQNHLHESPFTGEVYLFRGKSGNKIKVLWATPDGMNFLYKRLNDA